MEHGFGEALRFAAEDVGFVVGDLLPVLHGTHGAVPSAFFYLPSCVRGFGAHDREYHHAPCYELNAPMMRLPLACFDSLQLIISDLDHKCLLELAEQGSRLAPRWGRGPVSFSLSEPLNAYRHRITSERLYAMGFRAVSRTV